MRNHRTGTGLVEPLIALLVLLVAAVPLVAGIGAASKLTRHGRGVALSRGRAESALERAASARFDDLRRAEGVEVELLEPGLAAVRADAGRVRLVRLVSDPMIALR
jgi:hypothetical protein